jgi:hypothetical protein
MPRTRIFPAIRLRVPDTGDASPAALTAVLLLLLTATEVVGLAVALFSASSGTELSLSVDGLAALEFWRLLTFPFSCLSPGSFVPPALYASLLASIVLYCLAAAALVACCPQSEARLGTRGAAMLLVAVAGLQALASLFAFGDPAAFSPSGIVFALLTLSYLASFERARPVGASGRDRAVGDGVANLRLLVLVFFSLLVGVCAALDAGFRPMLAGLLVGPPAALVAFALKRRSEIRGLELDGSGDVAGLFYADDTELLTTEELRSLTDRLLEQISAEGMESLDRNQKLFLSRASARLRAMNEQASDR